MPTRIGSSTVLAASSRIGRSRQKAAGASCTRLSSDLAMLLISLRRREKNEQRRRLHCASHSKRRPRRGGGDEKKHSSVRVEVVGHGSSLQILGYQVLNDSNSWGTAFLVGDTPIPINSYNGVEQNNSEFSSRNSHFLSRGQRK